MRNFDIFRLPIARYLGIGLFVASLAACAPRVNIRGNVLDPEKLADIKPGELSRREVLEIMGSPSSVAAFDRETWYYISKKTETLAFFEPKVTERKVVIVRFDKKGVVQSVETLGMDAARTIEHIDRKTPTAGDEFTILDQLIGNFKTYTPE